jgi:hypothetical protein
MTKSEIDSLLKELDIVVREDLADSQQALSNATGISNDKLMFINLYNRLNRSEKFIRKEQIIIDKILNILMGIKNE